MKTLPAVISAFGILASLAGACAKPAPQKTTFEVGNHCGRLVTLFLGEDPNGEGTRASLGSGTVQSFSTTRADGAERVWILDEGGKGHANMTVGGATKKLEIGGDCASFVVR